MAETLYIAIERNRYRSADFRQPNLHAIVRDALLRLFRARGEVFGRPIVELVGNVGRLINLEQSLAGLCQRCSLMDSTIDDKLDDGIVSSQSANRSRLCVVLVLWRIGQNPCAIGPTM